MGLQLRRGTNAERLQITPLAGELLYTTDTKVVYVGDGATIGGLPVTAFTAEEAQDTVAPMFVNGSHTGIAFTYNDSNGTIDAIVSSTATELINDPMPQLGGNLDLNTHSINGIGSIEITGGITTTDGLTASGSARLRDLVVRSAGANIDAAITGYSITNGTDVTPGWIDVVIAKQDWTAPVDPQPGDFLGGYKISTHADNIGKPVALFAAELTASANIADPLPASNAYIGVTTNTGVTRFKFGSNGAFEAPIIKAANYATIDLPATPETGYIVFDSTSNEFKGWNGTTWVVLG